MEGFINSLPSKQLDPDGIIVGDRLRKGLNEAVVLSLMASFDAIGQLYPIAVKARDDGRYDLVAGAHRLEACRRQEINVRALILEDWCDTRLWEIAENLHRSDLTALERAEHIAEWVKLTEAKIPAAQVAPLEKSRGYGKPPPQAAGGINATVRQLGIDRTEAQRSVKIAGIPPTVKEAAMAAGLANNQSALLAVAKAPSDQQLTKVQEIAAKRAAPKPQQDVHKGTGAEAVTRLTDLLLAVFTDTTELLALLEQVKLESLTTALRERMDDRFHENRPVVDRQRSQAA